MTVETAIGSSVWPTEDEIAAPGFEVVVSCRKGDLAAGIYTTGDSWYRLTWSDGVANSWREKYSQLSFALARLAMLAFSEEADWELFARDQEEAEFLLRAKPFLQGCVE